MSNLDQINLLTNKIENLKKMIQKLCLERVKLYNLNKKNES